MNERYVAFACTLAAVGLVLLFYSFLSYVAIDAPPVVQEAGNG